MKHTPRYIWWWWIHVLNLRSKDCETVMHFHNVKSYLCYNKTNRRIFCYAFFVWRFCKQKNITRFTYSLCFLIMIIFCLERVKKKMHFFHQWMNVYCTRRERHNIYENDSQSHIVARMASQDARFPPFDKRCSILYNDGSRLFDGNPVTAVIIAWIQCTRPNLLCCGRKHKSALEQ